MEVFLWIILPIIGGYFLWKIAKGVSDTFEEPIPDKPRWKVRQEERERAMSRRHVIARDALKTDWGELLDREDVLILDTETTGLEQYDEVIEVGVIDTTGAERFHSLVMPKGRINPKAREVHGITQRFLKANDAPEWPAVYAELMPSLKAASVILAWNAQFDRRLLRQSGRIWGCRPQLPQMTWRDLLNDYRETTDFRCRLADAVRRENAQLSGQTHRAMGDCQAVLAVMRAIAG